MQHAVSYWFCMAMGVRNRPFVLESYTMSHSDHTRRHAPVDPGETQRHPPVPHQDPGITVPSAPVPPPPTTVPPTFPRPKRRRRIRRRASCLGCVFRVGLASTLFVVLFTALLAALYIIAPPPRVNVLVLGLDSRPGEGVVTRSDTIILATVDPRQLYAGVLSIPRDLYVNIPGYNMNRINAAHVLGESAYPGGGVELAKQTIEANFRVPVDRTVRMDFEAFVAIIDAAGGVDINVEYYFVDYEYPTPDYGTMVVEFQAGEQHMDGARALQYARIRHGSSDFERAARQQQVIKALVRQLLKPKNWGRWPNVYLAFASHVDTDVNVLDVILVAPTLLWVGPDGIDHQVLNRDMAVGITTSSGAAVLEPQWGRIDPLIDEMFRK